MDVRGKRILVVDDEFSIVETLGEILGWEGYVTAAARDGRAGLEMYDQFRPDVVIVDFMMPGMNGLEMIAVLRARPGGDRIPIVLMTAAVSQLAGEAQTWNGLLRKPFELPVLLSTLEGVLGR